MRYYYYNAHFKLHGTDIVGCLSKYGLEVAELELTRTKIQKCLIPSPKSLTATLHSL